MWKSALLKTLFYDMMPLKRQGFAFTWKTLDQLHARILASTVYACGSPAAVREALEKAQAEEDAQRALQQPPAAPVPENENGQETEEAEQVQAPAGPRRPSLFDEDKQILPLPQADMLLEFEDDGRRYAVLVSDRNRPGVESYVFRWSAERDRWKWPLLGMLYGPAFEQNTRIAVYEPERLMKLSPAASTAMVCDHSRDMGDAIAALAAIRLGLIQPEGETGRSAAEIAAGKKVHVASPTPSSMARAGRNRHMVGQTRPGARRS